MGIAGAVWSAALGISGRVTQVDYIRTERISGCAADLLNPWSKGGWARNMG